MNSLLKRLLVVLGLSLLLPGICAWPIGEVPAQDAKPKKQGKEEVEDPVKAKRKLPKVGDEESAATKQPPAADKFSSTGPSALAKEAEQAKIPAVRRLFSALAIEHDLVIMKEGGNAIRIEPVPQFVGTAKPRFNSFMAQKLSDDGKRTTRWRVSEGNALGIKHYEQIALEEVDELLKKVALENAGTGPEKALARLEMFQEAEKALTHVLDFHASALQRELREKHAGWDALEKLLQAKLRFVRLEQLQALATAGDWEEAFALAMRLSEMYPKQEEVLPKIADLLVLHARQKLDAEDYEAARLRVKLIEEQFPGYVIAEPIRKELQAKAKGLLNEALRLQQEKKLTQAMAKLQTAEIIWPRTPGVKDALLKLQKAYPILHVGVRELPEFLSPATAWTDSERQALELLFESLMRPVFDSKLGLRYEPELAVDSRLIPRGRLFQITRHAYWSNDKPVTAADVSHTRSLLADSKWPGYNQEWAELVERATVEGDPFHVSLALRRGYLDPLALMSFKVLPQVDTLSSADDSRFAKQPVGSGPFQYKGREGEQAVFVTNPHYGERPGKSGLPRIREIRFYQSKEPAAEFRGPGPRLLLDLSAEQYRELKSAEQLGAGFHTHALRNRRVYFLAVNHRNKTLQSAELRRALAHAIERETILEECFRAEPKEHHHALNGPFPRDSWAENPKIDPFKPSLARALAEKLGGVTLTLKYPEGDNSVRRACQAIQSQVKKHAGLQLELIVVAPRQLRKDVEVDHAFDLAYYHHDFATEDYWLAPLFDPRSNATRPGGPNYLGYQDPELVSRFRRALGHRDFPQVQKQTHDIHRLIFETMPLIPLWQLDSYMAVQDNLKLNPTPDRIDPLKIFANAEEWSLGNPRDGSK